MVVTILKTRRDAVTLAKVTIWGRWRRLFRPFDIRAEICSLELTWFYKWVYESEGGSVWGSGQRTFLAEQTHVQRSGDPMGMQSAGPEEWRNIQCGGRTEAWGAGRWQRWDLLFVAFAASLWVRDHLVNLGHHIYPNYRGSRDPASPFTSITFSTPWLHCRI